MSKEKRESRRRQEAAHRLTSRVLSAVFLLLVVLAAWITLSEENGGAAPTWTQLAEWFGLIEPAPGTLGEAADAATKIHFIDVGQGDAVLLEQDGCFALIDAGERDAADALVAYLQRAGVDRLALLVMTHPHTDHIGGMRAVVEQFPVDQVLLPDFSKAPLPTTSTFTKLLEAIEQRDIPAATARAGDVYTLGGGTLTVLGDGVQTENLNDLSVVTLFEADGVQYFSSGDGEKEVERALLDSGVSLRAAVYKAAHHGSSTSNTRALLEAVSPRFVVISCGKDNSYGHPHREAMETFDAVGASVYRTDESGTVIVYVDSAGTPRAAMEKEEAA